MLAAAEILRVKAPNIRFVIAGVGPYVGDIKAAAAQPNSNITFVGHLKPDDLYPMLGRCDIGLLSYAADTTVAIPDKFYDYAAAGLPIANSLQGEVRQIIECHNIGRTFTPDSAESMADCIQFLASSSTIRSEMSERAVGAARTWDAPVHFQKFVDLIEETMKHFTVSVRL
jgi:glycosyltransferase involved in cell wall biosynthesis